MSQPSHAYDPTSVPTGYPLSTPTYDPTIYGPYPPTPFIRPEDRDVDMASNKSTTSELLRGIQEQLHAQQEKLGQGFEELKGVITELKDEMVSFSKIVAEGMESQRAVLEAQGAVLEGITKRLDHIELDGTRMRKDNIEHSEELRKTQQGVEHFQKLFDKKEKSQTASFTRAIQDLTNRLTLKSRRNRVQNAGKDSVNEESSLQGEGDDQEGAETEE